MDFRGYVRALRRNLWLILVCVLLAAGATVLVSQQMEKKYQSQARVIVSSAQAETTDALAGGLLSAQRATTYVEVVGSRLLAERVRDDLGLDLALADLSEGVEAEAVEESAVLQITYTGTDPETAQLVAQSYAEQLVDTATEIETPDAGGTLPTKITVIDPASYGADPVSPKPVLWGLLAAFAGLLLGMVLALLRDLLDTTIASTEDLESVTDLPVLGRVGHEGGLTSRRKLVTDLDQTAARAEAFRVLRTNVQFVDIDSAHKVFVVTSSVKEEGKTSTAVNLALTLARAGIRTLLVDGDLRRPRVADIFEIDGTVGVTTVLVGKVPLDQALWHHDETGLDVLPSGVVPPNAAELLQTKAMATLLDGVRAEYDVVVIDSPPLLPVTDAALLSTQADGTLLVVRHGKARKEQVALSLQRLKQVDVTPVGVVLNDIPTRVGGSGYGYGYGTYGTYGTQQAATAGGGTEGGKAKRRSRRKRAERTDSADRAELS